VNGKDTLMRRRDLKLGSMYSIGEHANKDFKREMKTVKDTMRVLGLNYKYGKDTR
jgi:hypothetical protein